MDVAPAPWAKVLELQSWRVVEVLSPALEPSCVDRKLLGLQLSHEMTLEHPDPALPRGSLLYQWRSLPNCIVPARKTLHTPASLRSPHRCSDAGWFSARPGDSLSAAWHPGGLVPMALGGGRLVVQHGRPPAQGGTGNMADAAVCSSQGEQQGADD